MLHLYLRLGVEVLFCIFSTLIVDFRSIDLSISQDSSDDSCRDSYLVYFKFPLTAENPPTLMSLLDITPSLPSDCY
jgi:hypothetical protein